MIERKKTKTTWFVEPIGPYPNQILSRMLPAEEACNEGVSCADGRRHNLWRCPEYRTITQLKHDKDLQEGRDFVIWRQKGEGLIGQVSFDSLRVQAKRRKRNREARDQPTLF